MRITGSAGRRMLLTLAASAIAWAAALHITGGIAIETPWRLISSRNPVRPLAAALAVVAWYLMAWRRHWRTDFGPVIAAARAVARVVTPEAIVFAAVVTALVAGFGWGSRMGAGPDPSGYVSQADMLARGDLTLEAPAWSEDAPWDDAAYSATPVGWHPSHQTHYLAPMYSPGLPLIMAGVQLIAGQGAVFYVVPVLGAVLIWATYVLGTCLRGRWPGAIAAVLLLSSPTFLAMQLQVMSDVPVAAFITGAIAAAVHGRYPALAGVATAAMVLTRPNLAPLALIPLLLVVRRERWLARLTAFGVPVGVACVLIAALNWRYHGSPLISGYGALSQLYTAANVPPNLAQYTRWFVQLHTPVALVGLAAALLVRDHRWRVALVTLVLPLAVLALYAPWAVFHAHDWPYTRFLLPCYAGVFVGAGIVAAVAAESRWSAFARAAAVAAIAVIAVHGWRLALDTGTFSQRDSDARYARAVEYVRRLPPRSVLVSNAHSGTLRFYSGRDVMRFEAIRRTDIDTALAHLRGLGYSIYFVGDEFEIDQFRTMFDGTRTVAALPPTPRVNLGGVVIYELPGEAALTSRDSGRR